MSDFVAECRREWKRLRVPDAVAYEMAAELAADLSEAAAEGDSAEEVLGVDALDPRSFAASWAAERGVVPRAVTRPRSGSLLATAIGVSCVAALATGVAILATPSATTSALPAPLTAVSPDGRVLITTSPGGKTVRVWMLRPPPVVSVFDGSTVLIDGHGPRSSGQGTSTHVIAWALLIAGIAGLVATVLFWLRIRRRQSYA